MAQVEELSIDQGSDWIEVIQWSDDDGVPYNLTGFTARCQLKRNYEDPVIVSLTTENGGITITPLSGTLTLVIENSVTDTLSGVYLFDVEVSSSGGIVTRLVQGKITVSPSITV